MYDNYQNQHRVSTLQERDAENRKQMQEEQEKRNHDTMKSEVKKFVVYVLGLNPNTLEQSEELKRGMFKLSDAIEKQSLEITDEDVESFFSAISFVEDILSSYDKKEEAVECFKELKSEFGLELDFDKTIDSFLDFCKDEKTNEIRTICCQGYARKIVDSALKSDDKINDKKKQIEIPNDNIDVIKTNKDEKYEDKEDKVYALQKRYKKLSEFNDKSKYEQLDLSALNLLLLDMENYMMDAIQEEIAETNKIGFDKIQPVIDLHRDVSGFFLETAQSNVDKLLIDGCESCRLFDTNIKNISVKISNLGEDKLTNKNEYQAKIKFLEQSINANIRGDSLSSARIRGLHFVISSNISNELQSVSDEFCDKNDNCLAAILKIKQYRNLFVNEMSKVRDSRQKMSLQVIEELKGINENLDQICDKQELERLKQLPKTVNVEHSIKTGFWWLFYKFLNLFINNKQITPQNSLNDQIGAVVRQRFSQFKQADFIIPLNSLIIRSLGIEPDGEQYEIESLFNKTFTTILLPMLNNDLDGQIGSLADALYNVIPQNQNDAQNNSFNGVKYAISQYISDAMVECWVETIFDFIRMDSADTSVHLSRRNHTFDADMYFNNLKDNENRKSRFKEILHDRFSECRSNIVTNIEQEIKNGKNDHEICERLLKRNIELLDFCDKLHERNFGQLSDYIKSCINNMSPEEKNVRSNLQLNLKFSISSCKSKDSENVNDLQKQFLSNLLPSSQKAFEQSKALIKESINAFKAQEKKANKEGANDINIHKDNRNEFDLPSAHRGEIKTNGLKMEKTILIDKWK